MYGRSYNLKQGYFNSANGVDRVAYYIFEPREKRAAAIIQISHGMCEHIMRYEEFADFFCAQGFLVCGNDHIGHGKSAKDDDSLGYTSKKDGAEHFLEDIHKMSELAKREYPNLPLILLGHSMGSFIARRYMAAHGDELAAAMISGTAGPEMPAEAGRILAKLNILLFGERNRSEFIYNLSFGSYDTKKYPKGSPKNFWISRDELIRETYNADKFCNYKFTARAYTDLFATLGAVSKRSWAKKVPKELPTLMFSGDMDPVGNYGKGVVKIYERLKGAGVKDVTLKLYPNGHHEMLNETNRFEVYCDIFEWLKYHGFVKE